MKGMVNVWRVLSESAMVARPKGSRKVSDLMSGRDRDAHRIEVAHTEDFGSPWQHGHTSTFDEVPLLDQGAAGGA